MAQHHHHHHQESIAQQHQQQNLLDVLYCSEEHWEEELGEDYFHEEDEVEDNSNGNGNEPSHFSIFLEQDLFWDDGELNSLFSKEQQNELYKNLKTDSCLAEARREAVEWMLKVNAHYSFSALTAVLAVNYFDRFLLSFHFHGEKPWMPQLAAVGCLSLAAKVEETQVPLLPDLQVILSKSCCVSAKCSCSFSQIRSSIWVSLFCFRWRIASTYLRPKPSREWRFWCSQHFSGR